MMLLRANVLAKGHSGARPDLAELLLAMLNAGLCPPVPEQGSVGASGDLAPLVAPRAVADRRGRPVHGSDVAVRPPSCSRERGLAPVALGPKEGLTLINGTQAHTAIAALALARCARALGHGARRRRDVARGAARHAGRVRRADPRRARARLGQMRSAALLRALLADSEIRESHRARRSARAGRVRAALHAAGARSRARRCSRFAGDIIGRELNAATDNPLVFDDGDAAERRQLPRTGGRDGARLARDRADESRGDLRASHRPARASRPEPGTAAVPHARRRRRAPAS